MHAAQLARASQRPSATFALCQEDSPPKIGRIRLPGASMDAIRPSIAAEQV
jgi:hypothetical protein